MIRRTILQALKIMTALVVVMMPLVATSQTKTPSGANVTTLAKAPSYRGELYLIRGGFNVFSKGLDEMAKKLAKKGVKAQVISYTRAHQIAATIIRNQKKFGRKPIVLVGHSWGGNAVIDIAAKLKARKIRVNFAATIAATSPAPAPSNIRKLTNYYFKENGWGRPVTKGPGFRGILKNVDLSRDTKNSHWNADDHPRLQSQIINNVLRYYRSRRG